MKKFLESVIFMRILWIVAAVFLLAAVFHLGMLSGYRRARFAGHLPDRYERLFEGHSKGMKGRFMKNDYPDSHGALGKVVRLDLPTLVIADQSGVEKEVVVNNQTVLRQFRDAIKAVDLKVGMRLMVVGAVSDKNQIEAKLIRVMPEEGVKN